MEKVFIHVSGKDAGNSSKGSNFGSLNNQKIPHKDLKQKNYYGSLLKWTMFHSEALNKKEAWEIIESLSNDGFNFIVSDFDCENHERAIKIESAIKNYWNREKYYSEQKIGGRKILTLNDL